MNNTEITNTHLKNIISSFFPDHVDAIELPTVTDSSGKPLFTGLYSGPYFDLKRMTKNQTAQVGENALIHCAVKQNGKKSVRKNHLELNYTYAG